MKKIIVFTAVAAIATLANAQEHGRVLSATPVIQQVALPQQVCGNETVYSGNRTTGAGAVLGAVAGGAAGNAIGKGSGRAAATALGIVGGAVLGNQIEGGQPQYQNVQRCTTETHYENRTVGYDVVYEYGGRQYTTRTQTDPGRWIPVNVNVQPAQTYSTQPDPYASQGVYSQSGVVTSTYPVQPVYQAPTYVTPPVTVIEYDSRPYYHHRNPYWR